jgi:hypothetical protein
MMDAPFLSHDELQAAARTVHAVLPPTPQYRWPLLEALIAWGDVHPTDSLAVSGVQLEALTAAVPGVPGLWPAALGRDPSPSAVPLSAVFGTPRGAVTLSAPAPSARR